MQTRMSLNAASGVKELLHLNAKYDLILGIIGIYEGDSPTLGELCAFSPRNTPKPWEPYANGGTKGAGPKRAFAVGPCFAPDSTCSHCMHSRSDHHDKKTVTYDNICQMCWKSTTVVYSSTRVSRARTFETTIIDFFLKYMLLQIKCPRLSESSFIWRREDVPNHGTSWNILWYRTGHSGSRIRARWPISNVLGLCRSHDRAKACWAPWLALSIGTLE